MSVGRSSSWGAKWRELPSAVSRASLFAGLLAALALGACATDVQPDSGVGLERAFSRLRFQRPVFLTGAGDDSGRLFVVEQEGVIRVFDATGEPREAAVFLDISDKTSRRGNEEGLIGLAFHPNFRDNGQFFVHYSGSDPDEVGVLSRFSLRPGEPNRADPASEEVLLQQPQPWRNHNGGMIAFGPDGYLYLSLGDGGAANDPHGNGQKLSTWLGSILRIDVDRREEGKPYAVPPSNPFVGQPAGAKPEIWAFGLRNVWRFSFDRENGDLWAADVGQNSIEEIDLIEQGGNYGWRSFEANERFDELEPLSFGEHIPPVAQYGRREGSSITGGYVYRGTRFPQLVGDYFFGDYASGLIWRLRPEGNGAFSQELVRRTGRSIASFGEDDKGELFLLSFDGAIYRLVSTAEMEDPFEDWPERLSETGLFTMGAQPQPAEHLVPYEVQVPFWSDGARKERFFVLPEGQSLGFREQGSWEVPVGATLVKNFRASHRGEERLIETRLIKRAEDGWQAATYIWNHDETPDAVLAPEGRQFELRNKAYGVQSWHAPSAAECASCHVEATDYVLGLTTAQLNRDVDGRSQLLTLEQRAVVQLPEGFEPAAHRSFAKLDDESTPVEERARAWLDVNCAMCHQPQGPGNASIDLRMTTALTDAGLVDVPPSQGELGIEGARLLAPGDPEGSLLLHRVQTLGAGRMPPIGSHVVDEQGVSLLEAWIRSMDA